MKAYKDMSRQQLQDELASLKAAYEREKSVGYKLDLTRGKPSPAQLDLSMDMLRIDPDELVHSRNGTDTRNYGALTGLDECKEFFGELLEVKPGNIIVGGNASLNLMYDCFIRAMVLGVYGGSRPWGQQGKIRFLCPAPGYDRHFRISERFGAELILIPMTPDGPDMDMVRQYVENDVTVKGIWCVPKYGNPLGTTYSPETVEAFAALRPAADDFRIFWDNAYMFHAFRDSDDYLPNIFELCAKYGTEDMVYEFASTSKITFAGAGLSVMAASDNNIRFLTAQLSVETIGYDKINQLRHVKFFGSAAGLREHMKKHAELMRPRFDIAVKTLTGELGGLEIGEWTDPNGGYFISFTGIPGTAKRTVQLCKDLGVALTGAGAAFPYGIDPQDSNVRLCPSYPSVEEVGLSMKLFCMCERIAAIEALLS